ncbi:MAG: CPBP family intramembrane metalloprotease [Bacteroidales bacterium]|nr:CPBP family intramembrane metalloprotease [Bacteroidales bacterium]
MFREPPFRNLPPYLKILALIMVMIITFLVVLALGVAISIPFFGRSLFEGIAAVSDYSDPQTVFALKYFQIVNQVGVFIAPAIIFVILTDDYYSRYLNLDNRIRRLSIIFGFILLWVSMPFINWLVQINNEMHLPSYLAGIETWMRNSEDNAQKLTDAFFVTKTWGGFMVNLLMIAVLAAIGEELIFRGILVKLFREWTGNVHLAVIIPALLFSTLHLQFYGFFGRLVLGIILGYLFVWSGSLWVPIVVHFLNNAMAVIVSFLDQRGVITTNLETFGTSQNNLVIIGSFLLTIFTMSVIYLHEKGYFKKFAKKRP